MGKFFGGLFVGVLLALVFQPFVFPEGFMEVFHGMFNR
jgi:hypothetical protein